MKIGTYAAARSAALGSIADSGTALGAVIVGEVDEGGGGGLHLDRVCSFGSWRECSIGF